MSRLYEFHSMGFVMECDVFLDLVSACLVLLANDTTGEVSLCVCRRLFLKGKYSHTRQSHIY
jgi:hypothetical protein